MKSKTAAQGLAHEACAVKEFNQKTKEFSSSPVLISANEFSEYSRGSRRPQNLTEYGAGEKAAASQSPCFCSPGFLPVMCPPSSKAQSLVAEVGRLRRQN